MRKKSPYVAALLVLGILFAGYAFLAGKRYTVTLTEADLQQKLDLVFPIEKSYYLSALTLRFSNPKAKLTEGSDRISFAVVATLTTAIMHSREPLTGRGSINTGLRYNPDDYSFYLDNPEVEEIEIQGIPVEFVDRVNTLAMELARERINQTPIYTLRANEFKQSAAKLVLKQFDVKDGKVVITLGI